MANTIKLKRGSGSDPGSSDLSVGELAIRTDTAKLFTKNDAGSVAEIGSGTDSTKMPLAGGTFTGDVVFEGTGTNITFDQSADDFIFNDGAKAVFGTGLDFQMFFDGNHARLNTEGNFNVQSDVISFTNKANNEVLADFTANGSVDLYYNNVKKFETTANGVEAGQFKATNTFSAAIVCSDDGKAVFGDGEDLQIYHDGSDSYIEDTGTGALILKAAPSLSLRSDTVNINNNANSENMARFFANGAVELYYDSVKKFETTTHGASITGKLDLSSHLDMGDNDFIKLGDGDDLQIYHDGTNSYLANSTGVLRIRSDDLRLQSSTGEEYFFGTADGGAYIYHNNNLKLQTTSSGISVTGEVSTTGHIRVPDNMALIAGTGSDLFIYHDGVNGSYIDNVTGTADLYIRNTNGNSIYLNPRGSEVGIKINPDAAVELYYDNSKKAETISEGMSMSERLFVGFSSRSSTVDASTSTLAAYGNSSTTTGNVAGSFFGGAVTSQRFVLSFSNNNGIVGSISTHGTQTQFNTTSDYRLKENTSPISDAITRLKLLKPLRFNFTSDATRTLDGFLAHEVSEAVPEAVSGEKDGMAGETYYEEGETLPTGKEYGDVKTYSTTKISPQQLDPTKLIPLLTAALQESISKIEILENKVAVLESS